MWTWKCRPKEFVRLTVRGEELFIGYCTVRDSRGRTKTAIMMSGSAETVISETNVPEVVVLQREAEIKRAGGRK